MTAPRHASRRNLTLLPVLALFVGRAAAAPPPTVDQVDVERYLGRWYEIALLPNMFQGGCARNTHATYGLRDDGLISVTNRCTTTSGDTVSITGVAKPQDPQRNSKLKVSFFSLFGIQFFLGDYWVMEVGEDYDYALVGHPTRKWGWILARDPQPSEEQIQAWLERMADFGYDPDKFVRTPQTGVADPS